MLFFTKHPLIGTFRRLKGNPKTLILNEPLWGIPYNLIAPLATLYMVALGVTDKQLGVLLSVSSVFQMAFAIGGGVLTDKLGRRTTTMIGDIFGWTVTCLIWATANNFWFFLIAAIINCAGQVNQSGWVCLLVEDAEPGDIMHIYTWITIGGLVTVFVAPLSGLLIERFSLVPVARTLYGMLSFTMLCKAMITWRFCTETRLGEQRRRESRGMTWGAMLATSLRSGATMFRDRTTASLLLIYLLLSIGNMMTVSFSTLYMNSILGLSARVITAFPIITATVQMLFLFALQRMMDRLKVKIPMLAGVLLLIVCQLLLIFSPPQRVAPIALYVFMNSCALAMINPRRDTLVARHIHPENRAQGLSIFSATNLLLTTPFGYIAGWLSGMDRRLPFVFCAALYCVLFVLMLVFREPEAQNEEPCKGSNAEKARLT